MEGAARIVLTLLALALLLQLVQRGPGGAGAWLRAKFLGEAAAPAHSPASPAPDRQPANPRGTSRPPLAAGANGQQRPT